MEKQTSSFFLERVPLTTSSSGTYGTAETTEENPHNSSFADSPSRGRMVVADVSPSERALQSPEPQSNSSATASAEVRQPPTLAPAASVAPLCTFRECFYYNQVGRCLGGHWFQCKIPSCRNHSEIFPAFPAHVHRLDGMVEVVTTHPCTDPECHFYMKPGFCGNGHFYQCKAINCTFFGQLFPQLKGIHQHHVKPFVRPIVRAFPAPMEDGTPIAILLS